MEKVIKCIAIDDDAPALKIIEQFVAETPGLKLEAVFRDPIKATAWLKTNTVDILFLDIHMPQQNGLDFLRQLTRKPAVIFTTAFSEFAGDAFDLDALDYLRKPFSYQRFLRAINKAREHINIVNRTISNNEISISGDNYITIKADGKMIKVFHDEIVYVEAFQEYIKIHTTAARYITYERMKNIEAILPQALFMRVHRSHIVALKHVKSIQGNLLEVENHQVPVSKDMKEEVMKKVFK